MSSIKSISDSLKHSINNPQLLSFLNFLDESVCSPDSCYKELSEKSAAESEKTKKLEEEYLKLKTIESSLSQVLRESPPGSELHLFQKSVLPYLELLQELDPGQDFEPIIADNELGINTVISDSAKVSLPEVIDTVQRRANTQLQELLGKRRQKIEEEIKATLPPELLIEEGKCSRTLKCCVDKIKQGREEIQALDGKIFENFKTLEQQARLNISLAQKIGKEHVLGTHKEFLEARVKSLQLHVKNLRAKRKIIQSEIYAGIYNEKSIDALHKIHVELEMEVHKIAKQKEELYHQIANIEADATPEWRKLLSNYNVIKTKIENEVAAIKKLQSM